MSEKRIRIAVIGGGAAGMSTACFARERGASVTLYEKNQKLGRKLAITGKGRCNVTNDCAPDEFIRNVPRNPRFLYGAVNGFSSADTMAYFESLGVPLKTERGRRVFPTSDRAEDIVNALRSHLRELGVTVRHECVERILLSEDGSTATGVETEGGQFAFDRVIVATGGLSYPQTGSTGDGYRFAKECGHTVTPCFPSLVPLVCYEDFCAEMMGLSLKNTALRITQGDSPKVIYEDFGEMLFTHFGVSGPMILSASAHLDKTKISTYHLHLDLKPALDEQTLDRRLLTEFEQGKNKNFVNVLGALLPAKMIPVFIARSGIGAERKCNTVTREERKALLMLFKDFTVSVKDFRPIAEAIITSGGVSVKEISPKTMESKLVKHLYFAGEVIDTDAYTGGFNLQIAFSTAYAAANAASEEA